MDAVQARSISISELKVALEAFPRPAMLDLRDDVAFERDRTTIPGAIRCLPGAIAAAANHLEPWRRVVVIGAKGRDANEHAARELQARGYDVAVLEGGFDRWQSERGAVRDFREPTKWVTRERPKIDRIACPWLVRRFIDASAEFFYVPAREVLAFAATHDAVPYDVPDVRYGHVGALCSFDAFVRIHAIADPALDDVATIVRGADTGALNIAAQSAGLLAISLGLSRMIGDDHAMLRWGMLVYDSLYAWRRDIRSQAHGLERASALPAQGAA